MNISKFQIGLVFLFFFFTNDALQAQGDELCQQLMDAVKANSLSSVKAALKAGADINCVLENDYSYEKWGAKIPFIRDFIGNHIREVYITEPPLHTLFRHNPDPITIAKYLISQGADVEQLDSKGMAAIHLLKSDSYQCFKYFLDHQPDLNIQTGSGSILLHLLVYRHADVKGVRMLLAKEGIQVNHKNFEGNSALHQLYEQTCFFKDTPNEYLIRLLVQNGADLNETNRRGRTCLDVAKASEHTRLINVTLRYGGKLGKSRKIEGNSKAWFAEQLVKNGAKLTTRGFLRAIRIENIPLTKVYLKHQVDTSNITPFHTVAMTNNKRMIQVLLDAGFDINQLNKEGESMLLTAARCHLNQLNWYGERAEYSIKKEMMQRPRMDTTFIKYLFQKGLKKRQIELNICLKKWTKEGASSAYRDFFIRQGAIPNDHQQIVNPKIASDYIHQNKYDDLQFILKHGFVVDKSNLLSTAVSHNKIDFIHLLFKYSANPNAMIVDDSQSHSVLFEAVKNQNIEMIEALLKQGANPDLGQRGIENNAEKQGTTPLIKAIQMNRPDIVELLLRFDASAILGNPIEMVKDREEIFYDLLDHGASIQGLNLPQLLIEETYSDSTLILLIKKRIDLYQKADETHPIYPYYLPIEIALVQKKMDLVDVMLTHGNANNSIHVTKLYAKNQIDGVQVEALILRALNLQQSYLGDELIHLAIMRKDEALIKHLLKLRSTDLEIKGSKGKKPYRLAKKMKLSREIIALLKG